MRQLTKTEQRWNKWLRQSIWLDDGVYNALPRVTAIEQFVKTGLYPFVKSFGYQWALSEAVLIHKLLHLLFMYWERQPVSLQGSHAEHELLDQYTYLLDTEVWDEFWSKWSQYEDFNETGYANAFRYDIHLFVWNYLDLEGSEVTQEIYEEMEIRQELEDQAMENEKSKGRDDPYLQDLMAESKSKYTY